MTVRERRSRARTGDTWGWLLKWLSVLLGGAVLTFVTSLWAVWIVADTAETVRDRTTGAVLETAAARLALTAADRAVIASFAAGHASLTGPGQDYTNRLAAVHQSLAKVAEVNQAEAGGGRLRVVTGLLAAYAGAIGQADAHYRDPAVSGLGAADLWYASRLLHDSGGVLEQLRLLQDDQRAALVHQLDDGTLWPQVLWLLPVALVVCAVFLVLLGRVQWLFFKRFRRLVNVWLVAATAATAYVAVSLVLAHFQQHQHLDQVRDRVDTVLAERQAVISDNDAVGQRALADLLAGRCGAQGCGPTVDAFRTDLPSARADAVDGHATDARQVTAQTGIATDSGGRVWLVPLAALLACGFVLVGVLSRFTEYRSRR